MREGPAPWSYLPSLFLPVLKDSNAQRVLLAASLSNMLARTIFISVLIVRIASLVKLNRNVFTYFGPDTNLNLLDYVGREQIVCWFSTQLCDFDQHHPAAFARLRLIECEFQMNKTAMSFIVRIFQIKPQCPFPYFFTTIFASQKHSRGID